MIESVKLFLERAREHTPACKERTLAVMHSKSVKELYEAATDIQGIEFLSKAIGEGWGMDAKDIERLFGRYINGGLVADCGGYTSAVYCSFRGEVEACATVMCFINSHATLHVPAGRMCKLYVTGCSDVLVTGDGKAFLEYKDEKSNVE